jgi:hypothetical protein
MRRYGSPRSRRGSSGPEPDDAQAAEREGTDDEYRTPALSLLEVARANASPAKRPGTGALVLVITSLALAVHVVVDLVGGYGCTGDRRDCSSIARELPPSARVGW